MQGAGVGANANSRVDQMTFMEPDTLAELVWSPRTGLSIKFADRKPCFTWEDGPSNMELLRSKDNQDQTHSVSSLATCHGHPERLFEDGMTSGVDKSSSDIISPLKIEAVTQCGTQEHVEKAQDAISENIKRAEDGERSFCCRASDEKHEVESHGSMESCKSRTPLTKRKRRSSLEQQLILGSKRIKKEAHECRVKKDTSFMNWLSNMLKGLKNHENYDRKISIYDETRGLETRKMGFQNGFQSLFLPDLKAHETIAQNENYKPVGSSKKPEKCSPGSFNCLEIKEKETLGLAKHISFYERVSKEVPKGMFDTIRRLRLSRTDILKWTNSRLPVAHLDGFFVRLRLAKWEGRGGGSRYYVACVTGLQGENPWTGLKQPIRVKVGGVKCFVESQHVSNCDFLEDELIAWWAKTSKNGGTPVVKDLKSKLTERRTLGL